MNLYNKFSIYDGIFFGFLLVYNIYIAYLYFSGKRKTFKEIRERDCTIQEVDTISNKYLKKLRFHTCCNKIFFALYLIFTNKIEILLFFIAMLSIDKFIEIRAKRSVEEFFKEKRNEMKNIGDV